MRILLTGATGFLGNNLLRQLLDDDHEMVVTIRHSSDPRPLDSLNVEKVEGDLTDPHTIASAMQSIDLVIHSAAAIQLGWSKLDLSRRVNVDATKALAEAARRKGVRMVHVSTVDALAAGSIDRPATEEDLVPSKPPCSYVVSKRQAETAFLEQVALGLDGIIVNPGFMVGPWDWKPSSGQMMLAIANRFVPLAPSGGCSVVDVRDVTAGIIAAYDFGKTGQRYILGGENLTYLDLWQRMARTMNRRPPIGKLPAFVEWTAGRTGDLLGRFLKSEPQVNSAATRMGSLYHWYSSQKAISQFGYTIGDIDAALDDAWVWFVRHGYV